ncbi:unnamed protein product [Rangifer tarandus platyrhynchus]|uniref:Uncharacterized protein n=2 Tax=Rangifer tarandus platyrhynchus TaxID=3082113 RepID=A0ACB0ECH9_RANTA|nr:unnamed protein product [Rangifer tarandus platyrhynchus]CAI9698276.1 unnamed protein product [Rangifer tarandus platyrhynchus]
MSSFPWVIAASAPRAVPAPRRITEDSFRFSPPARLPSAQVPIISQNYRPRGCRKGHPIRGLRVGSCLTLGNESSEEIHELKKQETLLEGVPRRRAAERENPGGLLRHVTRSLVLRPVVLTQDPSRGCARCSAKMDVSEEDSGRWKDMGASFGLCLNSLVGGGLVILCSLPGLPVSKELKQMISMVPPG